MEIAYGRPFTGHALAELLAFLDAHGLRYMPGIQFTVNLYENDGLVGTGSLTENIVQCVAVSRQHQGENLSAIILTALTKEAFLKGDGHLFLYTKPESRHPFESLGFFEIAQTQHVLLMENRRNGAEEFVHSLPMSASVGDIGCIVINGNPPTYGHLHLIEIAASQCAQLYVFIRSSEHSPLLVADRCLLVRTKTAHLSNVLVCPTGNYLIPYAAFPDYFLRDCSCSLKIHCQLDLKILLRYFVSILNITKCFIEAKPLSALTVAYNRELLAFLPPHGVQVLEIPHLTDCD
ncbi:MAG: [citrate (pro-3S)-lyase] ligase [Clostridia bacterium]